MILNELFLIETVFGDCQEVINCQPHLGVFLGHLLPTGSSPWKRHHLGIEH